MWWITPPANPPYELFWIERLFRLKRERLVERFEKMSRGP
jgi:hypothetical protein